MASLFFFAILFFATWAGGAWIIPFGPQVGGTFWLLIVLVGVFVALLLDTTTTTGDTKFGGRRMEAREPTASGAAATGAGFCIFLWLLLIGLLAAGITDYVM